MHQMKPWNRSMQSVPSFCYFVWVFLRLEICLNFAFNYNFSVARNKAWQHFCDYINSSVFSFTELNFKDSLSLHLLKWSGQVTRVIINRNTAELQLCGRRTTIFPVYQDYLQLTFLAPPAVMRSVAYRCHKEVTVRLVTSHMTKGHVIEG